MALFGPFSTVYAQAASMPQFAGAFAYVAEILTPDSAARRRLKALAIGASEKVELSGGAFAIEQVYQTKLRAEGFFESHRKYIDVQVIVEGSELMEVEDISRLGVDEPYLEERDLIKYGYTSSASELIMRSGDVALFFPVDGHMPSLQLDGRSGLVRKTVVKVPV
jgi:biofilm protein TabA